MKFLNSPSWKIRITGALISGVLASFALPPTGFVVLILMLGLPFWYLTTAQSRAEALMLGWGSGIGWFIVSLWWICHSLIVSGGWHMLLIPFAILGLPLLLGLFWGVAFMVTAALVRGGAARLLLVAAMLSLAEYGRGFILTGFPWNAPGMIFANHDLLLASASFLGLWGLSFMAILTPILPVLILTRAHRRAVAVAGVILIVPLTGIYHSAQPELPAPTEGMDVRIIQPNVEQREKWEFDKKPGHRERLKKLSLRPAETPPELIIWPETAFAGYMSDDHAAFNTLVSAVTDDSASLITGGLRLEEGEPDLFYNAAALVGQDGRIAGIYEKQHLVPLGEFIPLRSVLPFVEAIAWANDFSAGEGASPIHIMRDNGARVSVLPLICYEVIFPSAVRKAAHARAADLIITITNDAWFGDTIGPRQHLAMAQVRSAELGLPMLRAANTGVTAAIDARGRIITSLDYGREGLIDVRLGGSMDTFYNHYGDLVFFLMVLVLILIILIHQGLTTHYSRR